MKNLDHNRLLNKIARLYYEQELTQNEIAGQLRLSRQKCNVYCTGKVGRCRPNHHRPIMGTFTELENSLEQHFGLREALVMETSDFEDLQVVTREVGAAQQSISCASSNPGFDSYFLGGTLLEWSTRSPPILPDHSSLISR